MASLRPRHYVYMPEVVPPEYLALAGGRGTGKFLRSIDDGQTWTLEQTAAGISDVMQIVPTYTSVVAITVDTGGNQDLYRSTDDGESWTYTDTIVGAASFRNGFCRSNSGYIATAVQRNVWPPRGDFYTSLDDGLTYGLKGGTVLFASAANGCAGIVCLPNGHLISVWDTDINNGQTWRSLDGGASWSKLADLINYDPYWMGMTPNGTLIMCTAFGGYKLYKSTDEGVTWTQIYTTHAFRSIIPFAQDSYTTLTGVSVGANIYASVDNGATFGLRSAAAGATLIGDLCELPTGTILAATNNGIYRSVDQGGSWALVDATSTRSVSAAYPTCPSGE